MDTSPDAAAPVAKAAQELKLFEIVKDFPFTGGSAHLAAMAVSTGLPFTCKPLYGA